MSVDDYTWVSSLGQRLASKQYSDGYFLLTFSGSNFDVVVAHKNETSEVLRVGKSGELCNGLDQEIVLGFTVWHSR